MVPRRHRKKLKLPRSTVFQVYKDVKVNGGEYGKKRKQRRRKTTLRQDRDIHRLSLKDRFNTAVDVHREITARGTIRLSAQSIRNCL